MSAVCLSCCLSVIILASELPLNLPNVESWQHAPCLLPLSYICRQQHRHIGIWSVVSVSLAASFQTLLYVRLPFRRIGEGLFIDV